MTATARRPATTVVTRPTSRSGTSTRTHSRGASSPTPGGVTAISAPCGTAHLLVRLGEEGQRALQGHGCGQDVSPAHDRPPEAWRVPDPAPFDLAPREDVEVGLGVGGIAGGGAEGGPRPVRLAPEIGGQVEVFGPELD